MIFAVAVVEGQTEERFMKSVLNPYLNLKGVHLEIRLLTTSQGHRGGLVSYEKLRNDILKALKSLSYQHFITSMLDFYGLPSDFPEKRVITGTPQQQVEALTQAFQADVQDDRFFPYLSLHEFEALLFADPQKMIDNLPANKHASELLRIREQYQTPEDINQQNPPSKRITAIYPQYKKVTLGAVIAQKIGIERMRQECSHFNQWFSRLEELGS